MFVLCRFHITERGFECDILADLCLGIERGACLAENIPCVEIVDYILPPFCYLELDRETPRNLLRLASTEHADKFQRSITPGTPEHEVLAVFFQKIITAQDEIAVFYHYVSVMLDFYLEKLKKRNAEHYAVGVDRFFSDIAVTDKLAERFPPLPRFLFRQSRCMDIEYTPMTSPLDEKVYCLAERMEFQSVGDFLHVDFFRALTKGNAPRRCHNCGRFFLLTAGYDTCAIATTSRRAKRSAPAARLARTSRKRGKPKPARRYSRNTPRFTAT